MNRRERSWAPATRLSVRANLDTHILATFGDRPLSAITRAQVERWAADLELAPSSVATTTGVLAAMLSAAVEDGRLTVNPARGARLPKVDRPKVVPLTGGQVHTLIDAVPGWLRAGVVLAANTGLRQGEAMGLTVDRVNFLRRQAVIDRQLWSPPGGPTEFAPPKSKNGYRTIALSDPELEALGAHLEEFGTGRDDLIFHQHGKPVTRQTLAGVMHAAAKRAALDGATWHSLRHHHASVLLSAGVSPVLVAERLGDTVATLLSTYSHVIRSDEDRVRVIVAEAFRRDPAEDFLRTSDSGNRG